MSRMKKLLIIAGGTGGHIFPALAVADALKAQGVLTEWLGGEVGMEQRLVGSRYPLHLLAVKGLRGKSIWVKCMAPVRLLRTLYEAMRVIKAVKPDVVLGMGGYVSGPGCLAAWLMRIPVVIHEQNAIPGFTNRILSHIAKTVLQAFPDAFPSAVHALTVGNPVRESIRAITRADDYYQTRQKPWRILVLGGSQGAQPINRVITSWLSQESDRGSYVLWHQTGQKEYDAVQEAYVAFPICAYRISPFIEKMEEAYQWADIVICRSGALTVSEIATVGLPSVLIPYPYAVDDHQFANASFLTKAGAGVVFRESDLTAEKLGAVLKDLLSSPDHLQRMLNFAKGCAKPDATAAIIAALK